jgi:glutamate dehydrogenase (NAD(P)+)
MVTATARYKESPVETASWNFSSACGRLSLDPDLKTLLAMPYRELSLQLPLRMDDGNLRVFRATRLLHSNSRGPAAGTLRLAPGANADLAFALANVATWTAAVVNVPFGGASGVIDCDPRTLSDREHETLIRRFAARTNVVLGPYQDVAIAANETEAALLLDEYSSLRGFTPACVAGKGPQQGGAAHSSKAQPRAAALVLREVADQLGRAIQELCVAIYAGPESVTDYLAEFVSIGCKVVAVGDGTRIALDDNGIHPGGLSEALHAPESKVGKPSATDLVLGAACDVLVLAASEGTIHATNASGVRTTLVLEAAPLGITPSADAVLRQQRAVVIPDLLAASGAMIAAHSEWSANLEQKQLQTHDIEAALEKSIPKATKAVFNRSKKDHSSLRAAAYCVAVERVARTERLRGI